MAEYFDKFPLIQYQKMAARDLTRRANFLKSTVSNPFVFLPYTIEEDMRPEDIAYYYYGSTDYTWLIYLANNIIDPYHQWPLSQENFNKYLIEKYAAKSGKTGYEVIDWMQNETIDDNILYYYKEVVPGSSYTITEVQVPTRVQQNDLVEISISVIANEDFDLPTGDVRISIDSVFMEIIRLVSGEAKLVFRPSDYFEYGIGIGDYIITAEYLGTQIHIVSEGAANIRIVQ
jgi:hypothetical protein